MTRINDPAAVQPALVDSELTAAEVAELWSIFHGDIMESSIRVQLRAGLGLCPRHTWGYAVPEIELWQTGAGPRGGHQPFDVSVLYEDLLDHVAGRLRRRAGPFRRNFRHVLVPRHRSRICSMINRGHLSGQTPFRSATRRPPTTSPARRISSLNESLVPRDLADLALIQRGWISRAGHLRLRVP